ncbi:MAG TPA: S53 family peptidase [Nitrososphaerales archaeon]|nr:S53 family peptidase [Nitrososphaerales archaeon]
MSGRPSTVSVSGSERMPLRGSRPSGRLDPHQVARVTVMLKARSPEQELSVVNRLGPQLPRDRTYLSRSEFERTFGSTREELDSVRAFAMANSLDVVEESSAKRSVVLSGTVARLSSAFNVSLARYEHPMGAFRGRTGPVNVPQEIAPIVRAVLGLDSRPQAQAHFRIRPQAAPGVTYTPPQVASLYQFPKGQDGSGQSIGIIELGGGFSQSDIQTYFSNLGVLPPQVTAVSVDGATNSPTGDPNGADAEVLLDIEVAGSVASKAQIFVYFGPNTDAGFVDAVNAALHGPQGKPSILSISWGSEEDRWTSQGLQALDQAFLDAATLGVTVCVASGDSGSSDGVTDGLSHVDYPASSQYVVGCGGTSLSASGGKITSEVAWDGLPSGGATGGGVSDIFPLPSWQATAGVPPSSNPGGKVGRGVPDVSGDADPQTGYSVFVDGKQATVGGTSAVAPLWAGLLALINQSVGKPVGFINPLLYGKASTTAFLDVVSGNNGAYKARPGWDPCTGWGSPEGAKLLAALSQGASASARRP